MVVQALIKIFTLMNLSVEKNNFHKISIFKYLGKNTQGFSLMEIMVVLMIISGILVLALPRMSFTVQDNKKVFRDITLMMKEVRNRAKLYNSSYRVGFKMDPEKYSYWVEKSSQVSLIDKKALESARENEKSSFRKDQNAEESGANKSPFQPDASFFKKEQVLPKNYRIILVESGSRENTYSDGTAYIHFFPQGFIEPSVIQIEDPKKNIWTLYFNPLTGTATTISEAKSLKDIQQ